MTPQDRRRRDLLLLVASGAGELGPGLDVEDLITDGLIGVSFAGRRSGGSGFTESSWLTPAGQAWLDEHSGDVSH